MLLGNMPHLSKHMLQEGMQSRLWILSALSNKKKFCLQELEKEKKEKRYIFPLYDAMAC
jgi:hypothetical protein